MTGSGGAGNPLSPRRFYVAMIILLLAEILGSMEQTMILAAIPAIVRQFGNVQAAGWLLSAFGLVMGATAAIGGGLGDRFGRKRLLLIVIALGGIGSLVSALAHSLNMIIIGRAIQGTAGIILPLVYGIARDLAPPGRSPFWIGLLTGGYAFAAAFGYVIGGVFADAGSWVLIFTFTAAFSLVSLALVWVGVPKVGAILTSTKIDLVGGILFAPAVALILYGLTQAGAWGWDAVGTWACIGSGGALLVFWAWYELRHDAPLIDVRLLRQPEIAVGNACSALAAIGSMQLAFVLFLLLQQPVVAGIGLGVSATLAGVLKLPSNASSLAGAPLGGWISGRYGARWTVVLGGVISALAWIILVFAHYGVVEVVALSVLCGFGNILLLVGVPNMLLENAPVERSSEVSGMGVVTRGIFFAVGAQAMAAILATSHLIDPASGAKLPSDAAYRLAFIAIAATSIAIVLLVLATLGWTRRRPVDARAMIDNDAERAG